MVVCNFCLNFDGMNCREANGTKYGYPIKDPFEEIDCPTYLEKALAGLYGLGGFF